MDVIGNNIANVNTNGYKSSRVTFQDMLSQTLKSGTAPNTTGNGGSNPSQVGLGMVVGSVDILQTQGNLQSTGKATDMALQGDGFFVLSNDNGATYRYSRDGAFDINQNGDLVNAANGYRVQGWSADNGNINTTAAVGSITIRIGAGMVAKSTENVSLSGNLNAEGDTATTGTVASITTALYSGAGTAAVGTTTLQSLTDSAGTNLGVGSSITINGRKNGVDLAPVTLNVTAATTVNDLMDAIERAYGIFDDSATAAAEGVSLDAAGLITVRGNRGTVNALTGINIGSPGASGFNTAMDTFTETAAADGESMTATLIAYDSLGTAHEVNVCFTKTGSNEWTWNADCADQVASSGMHIGTGTATFTSSGAFDQMRGAISIALDNGADTPLAFDINGSSLTQFSSTSEINVQEQDGYAAGTLEKFSVGSDGVITGIYTNGMTNTLAQMAIARVSNPSGMTREGENLLATSTTSGLATLGVAGSNGRGNISNGVLEMSNVDLAQEFTNMIITQRGFQANAKIITISDDMLSELVNLKR
jgi:flagellar hook protein FlgE